MDASRAEIELENDKLRSQIGSFQSDMDRIQGQMEQLIRENERLRQEVRRSGDERMTGAQTTSIGSHRSDPSFDIQKRQIQLLEEQKEYLENLYQESEDTINRLQAEINDLKHPLQPHLMKLDMETKLIQEDHARVEGELMEEIRMIREELTKSRKELVHSQLRIKELERDNEQFQLEVHEKQDDLRQYLKKEMGYDGKIVAFQSAIDALEIRLQHALNEKETAQQQREDLENKLKTFSDHNNQLHQKLDEMNERLRQQMEIPLTTETRDERNGDLIEHDQVHRTIDALIAQAAMKTRDAVEEVQQKYNENLEKILQEYNQIESELDKKKIEFEKCLRAKRLIEEELDKTIYESKLFHEKNTLEQADAEKRRSQAERERNEIQIKYEQLQQNHKILQQTFDAEKANHQLKEKDLTERFQKINSDLDRTTNEYTSTFNELNEVKKKMSTLQNEQTSMQRRMTDVVKRHEEQMLDKEKDCLVRLAQRDEVNRSTFNELRNLVNRQQRMIVKYKEECHTIASQSETKIHELKQKIEHLRNRNEQLQSDMADLQRKDAEMNRILTKNANRIKTLEERLKDTEEQAIEASRRVAKQLVRDRLAILPSDHYSSYSGARANPATSLFGTNSMIRGPIDSIEPMSDEK